jgi:hypothetical protein
MADTLETMRQIGLDQHIVFGLISGKLTDGSAALADAQVTVKLETDARTFPTNQDGIYLAYLRQNTVDLIIEKEGYQPYSQQVEIRPNEVLCMPAISLASAAGGQGGQSEPVPKDQPPKYLAATTTFTVTYNFAENGGTSATRTTNSVIVGQSADLTPAATKEEWNFVGWNTNPNAETGLASLPMAPDNVTLYAIYKKTLTATFTDYDGTAAKTRQESQTIYNKATEWQVTLPEQSVYTGWTSSGWVPSPTTYATGHSPNSSVAIQQSTTFYGVYRNQVTLTYSNGGSPTPPRESRVLYINSSDVTLTSRPFTLAQPGSQGGSFAGWALDSPNGPIYSAGSRFGVPRNATLYGVWK